MHQAPPIPFVFGALYWRKAWIGAACPPIVLSCRAGRIRMSTAKEVVFDVPVHEATVRCTKFGTLKITANGRTYPIVGEASAVARSLSPQQLDELNHLSTLPGAIHLGSQVRSLYRSGPNGISVGATAARAASSMTLMPHWVDPLVQSGVPAA